MEDGFGVAVMNLSLQEGIRTDGTACYSGRYESIYRGCCRKASVNRSGNTGLYARLLKEDGRFLL